MIGPTSTFYNPEESSLSQGDSHAQYQQWLDAYTTQQPPQSAQSSMHSSYRRDAAEAQQNVFNYIPTQYNPSAAMNQYAPSNAPSAPQASVRGNQAAASGSAAYQPPPDVFAAFYPDMQPMAGSSTSSPDQTHTYTPESTLHSFSNTPEPAYVPQHRTQPSYPSQQHLQPPSRRVPSSHQNQPSNPPLRQTSQYKQQAHTQTRFVTQQQPAGPPQGTGSASSGASASQSNPSSSTTLGPQGLSWNTKASPTMSASSSGGYIHVSQPNPVRSSGGRGADAGPSGSLSTFSMSGGSLSTATPDKVLIAEKAGSKRKRAKKDYVEESGTLSDSDSDDDDGDGLGMTGQISVGMGGLGVVGRGRGRREKGSRLPGACTHCKKLKLGASNVFLYFPSEPMLTIPFCSSTQFPLDYFKCSRLVLTNDAVHRTPPFTQSAFR
ncbi:hypothetical protein CPB83DRAFT_620424 [Crepidotus variabilis]|uniref:Uncharacterized protein n=1 Tax=Crepidotus variabilis TaxID=179855 RepID=A0A9P6E807_9AGAR|nr:hypothetical protein CPB83DRAFT_620424 [Crepidotus variabilis]